MAVGGGGEDGRRKNVHEPIPAGLGMKMWPCVQKTELHIDLLELISPVFLCERLKDRPVSMFPNVPLFPPFVVSLPAEA